MDVNQIVLNVRLYLHIGLKWPLASAFIIYCISENKKHFCYFHASVYILVHSMIVKQIWHHWALIACIQEQRHFHKHIKKIYSHALKC